MPIENVKHGDYIVELKPGYSYFKEVVPPQVGAFGDKDLSGMDFSLGWSLLTQPFLMVNESHNHDFDQFLFFMGGDPNNVVDYDAEIELGLDNSLITIDYPACVRIPKGLMHGPLNIKTVNKPLMFIDIVINPFPSVRPQPPESKKD